MTASQPHAALPANLKTQPRLGLWLDVAADGTVLAYSGKVELGQGIWHALALIVAQELRVPVTQIHMVPASTARSPDEAVTSGSLSVQDSGAALRCAATYLRETCRTRYAQRYAVPLAQVTVQNGVFSSTPAHPSARYADLVDAALWAQEVDAVRAQLPATPTPTPTPATEHAAQAEQQRPDIAAKVFGQFEYINDKTLPGMVYGLVFRPKTLQAQVIEEVMVALQARLSALPDVLLVQRDGLLLGLLARHERVLTQAARLVQSAYPWWDEVQVPAATELSAWLQAQPTDTTVVVDQGTAPSVAPARTLRALYERPYLQHASIGLCCALAQWQGEQLTVWSHSQGIFNLRRDLALALAVTPAVVTVQHVPAAGCYGHNGADDVAFDAAWLARYASGQPVRVQWTREQEMAHAPLGPAMAVTVEAGLDDSGRIVSWQQEVWSPGHGTRPGRGATPALLGAWQTSAPFPITPAVNAAMAVGGGSERNAQPPYTIAHVQVRNHRVLSTPLRVSALRSLGAHANVFAAESFMDELALAAEQEPLAFRLAHLQDPRAIAVLQEAARLAQWHAPALQAQAQPQPEGYGRGLAYARYKNTGAYCAVVAEVIVTHQIQLTHLHIAADIGQVIHPDGARNQLEGGAVQAASWTLLEAAQFDSTGITSVDWQSYPILTFTQAPQVQVSLMPRADCPALGAGECAGGPAAAAIANALHNALGLRVRSLPLNADNLMRWLQAA